MKFIDSHSHIYSEEFKSDRNDCIQKAIELGVYKIYMPNVDSSSIDAMFEVEQKFPNNCMATMGLHPCYVKKDFEKELYQVENWLSKRKFAAIGEIGIDLYWDKTFFSQQQEALKIQLELAQKYKLPIIIHCRNSFRETIDLIKNNAKPGITGVFHCFSGNLEEAQEVLSIGFKIGIGGVATFKNGGLDAVIPHLDLSQVVLETDSPYLAPVPYRGKRNEPSYIPIIAQRVADLKQCSLEEVAEKTTATALTLFNF